MPTSYINGKEFKGGFVMRTVFVLTLVIGLAMGLGYAPQAMAAGEHEEGYDAVFHEFSEGMEQFAEAMGSSNWGQAVDAAKGLVKVAKELEGLEAPHGAALWEFEAHAVEEHVGELVEMTQDKNGEHSILVFNEMSFHVQNLRSLAPHFLAEHGQEVIGGLAAAVKKKDSGTVHELGEEVHSMANNMIYAGFLARSSFANIRWQKDLQKLAHAGHAIGEAAEKGDWNAASAIVSDSQKSLKKYTNSLK
jgi:hypothetical protein